MIDKLLCFALGMQAGLALALLIIKMKEKN